MADNKQKNVSVHDKRRYKYGSLSIAFTVAFVAFIIVLNVVLSSLSLSGDLTVDLTAENYTGIGDETVRLLGELGKDLDITITFMAPRDAFDKSQYFYKGVNIYALIRDTAENYARVFDGSDGYGTVRVEYREINSDPQFEARVVQETGSVLTSANVIIKGKYHYRVLTLTAFFEVDESGAYYAFKGENKFTSAIIQSSISEKQIVAFTVGHGEPDANSSDGQAIRKLYTDAGFAVKDINLAESDVEPMVKFIVCYDPKSDFSEAEVDKLSTVIGNTSYSEYRSFVTFVGASTPDLANLRAYLADWGINYRPNYRVTDNEHSLDNDIHNINVDHPEKDEEKYSSMASYQLFKTMDELGGKYTVSMPEAVELYVEKGVANAAYTVETVLTTYESAYSEYTGSEGGDPGTTGAMPETLISAVGGYDSDNIRHYAYVMLIGSTDFADSDNLAKLQRGNKGILLSAARMFSSEYVVPDIDSTPFGDTALDIETGTAKTLTWMICTIVPGIVLILGTVMFFRRRHL
ncbi:MAG: Gldg family protein [Clostridia bacterium]|nr:Gldg family protein [Clostridia bacterium]